MMQGSWSGGKTLAPYNFSDRSPINVAPTGVNIGEILKPYQQASRANGGYGMQLPSRLFPNSNKVKQYTPETYGEKEETDYTLPVLIIGGVGVFMLYKYMR